MGQLVDLSLFAVSPTNDYHFALQNEPVALAPASSPQLTLAVPATTTLKPLPPVPNQTEGGLAPTSHPSRCILGRMKRIRLTEGLLPRQNAITMPKRASKTLQQRRNPEASAPTLTIPTPPAHHSPRVNSATNPKNGPAPMIWLPEEHVWLVADGTQAPPSDGTRQIYSYYAPTAPAPNSEPTLIDRSGYFHDPSETPPSYNETVRPAIPDEPEAEQSPVRTQFMSLMVSPKDEAAQQVRENTQMVNAPPLRSEERVSPIFQEAMSGISLAASRSEALIPGTPPPPPRPKPSRWFNRPDLTRSVGAMSDFLPGPEDPDYVAPLRIQRRTVPAA
jgi:hypothetical protein